MGILLIILGGLIGFVCTIWILVLAFRESIWWGLGCFISIIQLVFIFTHWEEAKKPFLISLVATALCILGFVLMPKPEITPVITTNLISFLV